MSMTRVDFILRMEDKTGMERRDLWRMYNAFVGTLKEGLIEGEGVQLAGFGTFLIRERAERTGRNPQTGEQITIPASRQVVFKASKTLKDAVNGREEAKGDDFFEVR